MFFERLEWFSDLVWGYPGLFLILALGLWFSLQTGFFQVRKFPAILGIFFGYLGKRREHKIGVHPLKAFFASMGGAIGVGNIVVVCAAIKIGGPGALFWIWIVGLLGMMLKYAEVYLGVIHRKRNKEGSYDGGPMYYLQKAYGVKWIPMLVSLLFCIYGVEIFIFSEVTETIALNWELNRAWVAAILLGLVLIAGLGGVKRVGEVCSALIPLFVLVYTFMCLWVFIANLSLIPGVFALVFKTAFTGSAATGGFIGSTLMMAMSQGAARGAWSADIGIGYASIIHSETSTHKPERQASLAIFGVFLDTFVVCTSSIILILITDVWSLDIPVGALVQTALSKYFPAMQTFMPIFIFLLGYSTLIPYFVVGMKCAVFLSARYGKIVYLVYAVSSFLFFSFFDPYNALIVTTLAGGLILCFNLPGIFLLRKEICFDISCSESYAKRPISK